MKLPKFLKILLGSLPSLQEPPVIFILSQLNPIQSQLSHFFNPLPANVENMVI